MAVEYRRFPAHPLELRKLKDWVKDAESILEIGCRYGDNLVFMAACMKGKKLVGVDLPGAEMEESTLNFNDKEKKLIILEVRMELKRAKLKLLNAGFDVSLFIGDSHDEDLAKSVAAKGPFDVVFIDGDHSYVGVKQDWLLYGRLGKQVIFHDVSPDSDTGVAEFWKEVSANLPSEDFIGHNSKMGIGRVWNTA